MKMRASSFVEGAWYHDAAGSHVALPLDVSQVSAKAVHRVVDAICSAPLNAGDEYVARAAIAALAAALGEETT
jgi:hypothetical protein